MPEPFVLFLYAPPLHRDLHSFPTDALPILRSEEIETEVFFYPAATHTEKDGSFTNTQRLLQWHDKAVEPPGDCRSDLDFILDLGRRLKPLIQDRPLVDLTWDYTDAESVLREVNGFTIADG